MAEFKLSVQMPQAAAIAAEIYARALPRLSQAVAAVAQQAEGDWIDGIYKARGLWQGDKDAYAASIHGKMTGAFSAEVWSDYRYAEEIETSRPARDLKKMLDSSLKVRVNKKGKRYLIIPFRHNTPGHTATGTDMPAHVYAQARQLAPSSVVGRTRRLSAGTGTSDIKTRRLLTVNQNIYQWGDRLAAGSMGLNRSGTQSSSYLTFRVMSEDSKGWIIPPRPGLYIVRDVVVRLQPLAEKVFSEAVKRDLE